MTSGVRPPLDFAAEKLDAFLVTGAANVRYASGFTGSNGFVLFLRDAAIFFTDPRYTIQAAQQVPFQVVVVPKGGLLPAVGSGGSFGWRPARCRCYMS